MHNLFLRCFEGVDIGLRVLENSFTFFDGVFEFGLFVGRNFLAEFLDLFFGLVNDVIEFVAGFDTGFNLLVFSGVGFSLAFKFFNFVFIETGGTGDRDFLFFAGTLILGADIKNAVRIDIKGDFNLRDSTGGGGNAVETEGL